MGIFTGTNNFRGYGYGIELPDGFLPVAIPTRMLWSAKCMNAGAVAKDYKGVHVRMSRSCACV